MLSPSRQHDRIKYGISLLPESVGLNNQASHTLPELSEAYDGHMNADLQITASMFRKGKANAEGGEWGGLGNEPARMEFI